MLDLLLSLFLFASTCTARDGLPDASCTPGATDPRVTQENVSETICVPGYSTSVRPPTRVTGPIKERSMADYGLSGDDPADYELDHLVSLQLGGAPADPENLWPEAYPGDYGARVKDRLENVLHRRVCAGTLPLAEARQMIATDWIGAYRRYVDVER